MTRTMREWAQQQHGFSLGEAWYSYDGGNSWTRQQAALTTSPVCMVVTKIDYGRGEVTLQAVHPQENAAG